MKSDDVSRKLTRALFKEACEMDAANARERAQDFILMFGALVVALICARIGVKLWL